MPHTIRIKDTWKKILLQKAFGKEILEEFMISYTDWKEIKGYNMVEEKSEQRSVRRISFF